MTMRVSKDIIGKHENYKIFRLKKNFVFKNRVEKKYKQK